MLLFWLSGSYGNKEDHLTPKVIEALRGERVVAVSAGPYHSLVLTEASELLSFGDGDDRRLGGAEEQHTPKFIEALGGERVVSV